MKKLLMGKENKKDNYKKQREEVSHKFNRFCDNENSERVFNMIRNLENEMEK